eukprot:scaffold359_cov372-Pavlova_lutheri.AAC.2
MGSLWMLLPTATPNSKNSWVVLQVVPCYRTLRSFVRAGASQRRNRIEYLGRLNCSPEIVCGQTNTARGGILYLG